MTNNNNTSVSITTTPTLYTLEDATTKHLADCGSGGIISIGDSLEEYGLVVSGSRKDTRYSVKTNLGVVFTNVKKPNIFNKLAYLFLGWSVTYDPNKCDPTDCKKCPKKVECALEKA